MIKNSQCYFKFSLKFCSRIAVFFIKNKEVYNKFFFLDKTFETEYKAHKGFDVERLRLEER